MQAIRPLKIDSVKTGTVVATAVSEPINFRTFLIANTGGQPLYINVVTATAVNGFLIPANTVLDKEFTVDGNLSLISNATGTTYSILFLDI